MNALGPLVLIAKRESPIEPIDPKDVVYVEPDPADPHSGGWFYSPRDK